MIKKGLLFSFLVGLFFSSYGKKIETKIESDRWYDQRGVDMRVIKVVIPAAGYGTRFLPETKSVPKELLPLLDKPVLQEVIEESVASEITDISIIVSEGKTAIQHYFTPNPQFDQILEKAGKLNRIESLNRLIDQCSFNFIDQPEMLGLAHAISMARPHIGNEYFGVILPDMVVFDEDPCMQGLVQAAQKYEATIIGVMEVPIAEISAYGSVKLGEQISENLIEITDLIEKPHPDKAYSNLAIMGRYVFSPAIFEAMEKVKPAPNGEIPLTDAIVYLAQHGHTVLAYKIKGTCFDLGRPHGWLEANIFLGLQSPDYGDYIRRAITRMM